MNPTTVAVRAGLVRGWIELRQAMTNLQDFLGWAIPISILLIVMVFMRGSTVPGTAFSLAAMTLPSVIGMMVAFNGLGGVAGILLTEREDGTLLRAKATPNGMLGYLISKIVLMAAMSVSTVILILVPGMFLFDGLELTVGSWVTLLWVLALGLFATMPIGAILGSLLTNPRNMALIMLPMMGVIGISGVFYPITQLPEWMQWLGQVFPVYWLGLGMRSALLPAHMEGAELGESWRHLETLGVLGVWTAIGLILAPAILRRMARRESGSAVAERRQQAMQRVN